MGAIAEETLTRQELFSVIDELSSRLGYAPGEFVRAVREGTVPDTPQTSEILVLVSLLHE